MKGANQMKNWRVRAKLGSLTHEYVVEANSPIKAIKIADKKVRAKHKGETILPLYTISQILDDGETPEVEAELF